jgi:hypothetical protein
MHKKLDSLWTGPYRIVSKDGVNSFNLNTIEGERLSLPVKKIFLKTYFSDGTRASNID